MHRRPCLRRCCGGCGPCPCRPAGRRESRETVWAKRGHQTGEVSATRRGPSGRPPRFGSPSRNGEARSRRQRISIREPPCGCRMRPIEANKTKMSAEVGEAPIERRGSGCGLAGQLADEPADEPGDVAAAVPWAQAVKARAAGRMTALGMEAPDSISRNRVVGWR
jgi:hypothetical protein